MTLSYSNMIYLNIIQLYTGKACHCNLYKKLEIVNQLFMKMFSINNDSRSKTNHVLDQRAPGRGHL